MGLSWLSASAPLSGITAKLFVFWKGVKRRGLNLCETWAFTSKRTDVHMTHYTSYNSAAGGSSQRRHREKPAIRGTDVTQMTLQPCETYGGFIETARRVVQHDHFTHPVSSWCSNIWAPRVLSHPATWSSSGTMFCVCATPKKKVFLHKSGGGKQCISSQRSVSCFPRVRDKPMSAHTPPVCMVYTPTHTHTHM